MNRPQLAAAAGATAVTALAAFLGVWDGVDYRAILWAPMRGLVAGFNPYAGAPEYLHQFTVYVAATAHAPWLTAAAAPLAALDDVTAYRLWSALAIGAVWLVCWLMVRPTTWLRAAGFVGLGALLMFSLYGLASLRLGQVTWVPVLGLALISRRPTRWAVPVGVFLLTVDPSFAVPVSILLAGFGLGRDVVRGWVAAALASLPVLAWAAWNAGGVVPLAHSIVAGFGTAVVNQNRMDLVALFGGSSNGVQVLALTVTAALAVALRRRGVALTDAALLAVTCWATVAAYAQPYDLLLPLVAAVPVAMHAPQPWWRMGWAMLVVGALSSQFGPFRLWLLVDPTWGGRLWWLDTYLVSVVLMFVVAVSVFWRLLRPVRVAAPVPVAA